jgi:DNA-binding GntR family transcriptional regulator
MSFGTMRNNAGGGTATEVMESFADLEPAAHRTLHEHAYQQIRQALMVGRFLPGQHMTIRGLAGALGISPTPIREALHRLTAEGALRSQNNRRLIVPRLSIDEFRELRDIRLSLEGLATERAVSRIEAADVALLRAQDTQIRALRRAGDVPGTIAMIHSFHHMIYAAAAMPTLKLLIEGLWLRNGPYLHLLFPAYAEREQGKIRAATLAAIASGDARAARQSMHVDIETTADYLLQRLTDQQ